MLLQVCQRGRDLIVGGTQADVVVPINAGIDRLESASAASTTLRLVLLRHARSSDCALGVCADLLSNIALSTLQGPPLDPVSVEDLFVVPRDPGSELAFARLWERPFKSGAAPGQFEHSAEWAGLVFQRTIDALDLRTRSPQANGSPVRSARVYVVPRDRKVGSSVWTLPDGSVSAQEHCVSSDVNRALSKDTTAFPRSQILADRNEGDSWPARRLTASGVTCPGLIVVAD